MKIFLGAFFMLTWFSVNGFAGEVAQLNSVYEVGNLYSNLGHAFGVGDHFHYVLNTWNGKAQLITRLKKDDEAILFARTSVDEFQIRSERAAPEIFFKFSTTEGALAPSLSDAFLVDFVHNNEQAAVLMASHEGYFYMRARSSPPTLSPPLHFLPHKKLIAGKWIPEFVMTSRDYYPEGSGPSTAKIQIARLKNVNEIEFFPIGTASGQTKSDVFSVERTELKKNGLDYAIPHMTKGYTLFVVNESAFHEHVTNGSVSLEEIKATILRMGYNKGEILSWVSGFQDKRLAAEISDRIEAAFATNNVKPAGGK